MQKPEIKSGRMYSTVQNTKKITKDELAKQIKRMRDRDAEIVTGVFKNLENPAGNGGRGALMFGYKAYQHDPLVKYELLDGERYALPRGVARHLNTNCYYKEYQHLPGEFGTQGIRAGVSDGKLKAQNMQASRKVHRYAFHSLEYMDDEDFTQPNLTEVTVSP